VPRVVSLSMGSIGSKEARGAMLTMFWTRVAIMVELFGDGRFWG